MLIMDLVEGECKKKDEVKRFVRSDITHSLEDYEETMYWLKEVKGDHDYALTIFYAFITDYRRVKREDLDRINESISFGLTPDALDYNLCTNHIGSLWKRKELFEEGFSSLLAEEGECIRVPFIEPLDLYTSSSLDCLLWRVFLEEDSIIDFYKGEIKVRNLIYHRGDLSTIPLDEVYFIALESKERGGDVVRVTFRNRKTVEKLMSGRKLWRKGE